MNKTWKLVVSIYPFVLLFIISNIVQGLILSCLWQWFAEPLGGHSLHWIHAIGLSVLFDFVTYHYQDYQKEKDVSTALQYMIIRSVIAFVVGYLIHLLMEI